MFVFLWCWVIFYISSIPYLKTDLGIIDLFLRKIAHFVEYAVLYILWWRAYTQSFKTRIRVSLIISIAACILYALSDEFHQGFVPGREGSSLDVILYDAPGAILTAYLIQRYPRLAEFIKR